jgi:hypothetical protein
MFSEILQYYNLGQSGFSILFHVVAHLVLVLTFCLSSHLLLILMSFIALCSVSCTTNGFYFPFGTISV